MSINKMKIHLSFIVYLFVTLYGGLLKESFLFLSCLFFHELSHIIMIKATKNKIDKIHLTCIGFFIDLKYKNNSVINKLLIYSGGLLGSLIFQFILNFNKDNLLQSFNLFILIINILPIIPLDGYNILYTLLSLVYEDEYLNDLFLLIGTLILSIIFIFYVIFLYKFILVLLSVLLFKNISFYLKKKKYLNLNKIIKFKSKY